MPRFARCSIPGLVHHLRWRFVDREWFIRNDEEREKYLQLLAYALTDSDWRCLAFCLMSNHLHFAMVAGSTPLASWSRKVNVPFAAWMNERYQRLGSLFAERAGESAMYLVEREAATLAYIHNNPVRAGVVELARDSTWSSHDIYLGKRPCPPWLHVSEGLERCGFASAPHAFDEYVNASINDEYELPDLAEIRRQARKRHGNVELGIPVVGVGIEIPIVARSFAMLRPSVQSLLETVGREVGTTNESFVQRYARDTAAARRIAMHCAKRLGVAISDVSCAIGVSRQRGSVIGQQQLSADERSKVELICEGFLRQLLNTKD
ncbi:MAG: transposase [Deltaproteobacteria bacterium]|nr:transposase [Deltaproteobacteria bacterium]MDQ3299575.1 hypothetical protein [Myxococcota bacterium]